MQSVFAWGRLYGFYKVLLRRIRTLLRAQKSTRKAPATFEAREARTRGCTPLVTPKQLGSIQKIQVASLKDFLCYADLKSLARRDIRAAAWFYCWRGCSRRELATADAVDLYDPSCEKANQKSPQTFLICKYKNIISADIVRAKRRQFKIVTSSKVPLKREREYYPL